MGDEERKQVGIRVFVSVEWKPFCSKFTWEELFNSTTLVREEKHAFVLGRNAEEYGTLWFHPEFPKKNKEKRNRII